MKATGTAILALVVGFSAVHAQAAGDYLSWQGEWKLNMEKTKYPPEIPVTDNELTVSKDDGKVLQYSDVVTLSGKKITASYDGAFDGKLHDAGGGQTVTYHHVDKATFASERKTADGTVAERSTCKLTVDGKTYFCHVELPQAGKPALVFDEYFDRVS